MRLIVERDPDVASLPRRTVGGTIDAAVMIATGGAVVGAAVGITAASGRQEELSRWTERLTKRELWSHPAVAGALWSLQLTGRNWRSPGMRVAGIRRVDARTLGPVGFRSATVALLVQSSSDRIGRELGRPATARAESRRLAANDEIDRMRASRPDDDPEELMRDAAAIRRRHGASTCTWMLPRMLVRAAVEQLPALCSSKRQTLTRRLAGIAVVLDR
jgi:hypothetical protein